VGYLSIVYTGYMRFGFIIIRSSFISVTLNPPKHLELRPLKSFSESVPYRTRMRISKLTVQNPLFDEYLGARAILQLILQRIPELASLKILLRCH